MRHIFSIIASVVLCWSYASCGTGTRDLSEGIQKAVSQGKFRFAMSMAVRMGDRTPNTEVARKLLDHVADSAIAVGERKLTMVEAAFRAASIANDSCAAAYGSRPFMWQNFEAVEADGEWAWGKLDVAGIRGYSTVVRMKKDGTQARSKVYFSADGAEKNQELDR